jgi:hypothetical protein
MFFVSAKEVRHGTRRIGKACLTPGDVLDGSNERL